jgi:hypothetical protein
MLMLDWLMLNAFWLLTFDLGLEMTDWFKDIPVLFFLMLSNVLNTP